MKSMNRKDGKKIAVMAALIMGFMVIAFMPAASAGVTSFTVMPNTGIAGAVGSYDAYVITDGVTSINVIIPAGFIAVAPTTGGVEIARFEFFNSSTKAYYGHAIITANDTTSTQNTVDISWELGGDTATTTQNVSYDPGATNRFESGFGDGSFAIITLPKETEDGSIEITINSTAFLLDAVMTSIKQFVRNPLTADDYVFYADGVGAKVTITAPSGRGIIFSAPLWFVDSTGDHIADDTFGYGFPGATPLVGDFNQDGKDDIAVVNLPIWFVDTNGDQIADETFGFGFPGGTPLVGDFNQDGKDDIAVVSLPTWFVDTNGDQIADETFGFGFPGGTPLVGDFDLNGRDDIAVVYLPWWFVDINMDRVAEYSYTYGFAGGTPLIGNIG
jgi:hypothetical protein